MFGGLIGAGILGNLNFANGNVGWRWLLIIEGTFGVGIASLSIYVWNFVFVLQQETSDNLSFFHANFPGTSIWLPKDVGNLADWRPVDDVKESDDAKSITSQERVLLAL